MERWIKKDSTVAYQHNKGIIANLSGMMESWLVKRETEIRLQMTGRSGADRTISNQCGKRGGGS
jgi:hypothetical protein